MANKNLSPFTAMLEKAKEIPMPPMSIGMPAKVPEVKNMPELDASKLQLKSLSIPVGGASSADKEYEALIKQDIEQRRGGIEGMQKQIEALQGKNYGIQDADLSGVMSFADSLRGTNLAQSYKAPGTQNKDQEVIRKLEEAMLKEKGAITDDMVQILKNSSDKEYQKAMLGLGRDMRFQASQDRMKEDTIRKDVVKLSDDYAGVKSQYTNVKDAVARGDVRSIQQVLSSMARNIGAEKGPLTEGDQQRMVFEDIPSQISKLQTWIDGGNHQVSPELQHSLNEMIARGEMLLDDKYNRMLNQRKEIYSAPGSTYAGFMPQGQVGSVIIDSAKNIANAPTPPQGAAPSQGMSFMEWKAQKGSKK